MAKKILIAEDDLDFLEQTKLYLEGYGYETITASTEKEATDIINNDNFDLAVLDLMMTNQDSGFVLSHLIKKRNKEIPVIIVTSVTKETGLFFDKTTDDKKSWIKADIILNKDIRLEQIKKEVETLLNNK